MPQIDVASDESCHCLFAHLVTGKSEEAMREVLGVGRGVQAGEVETLAMAAEARRETRQGAEGDEEGDGGDAPTASAYDCASHAEPQGFLSFVPCS